MQSVTTATPDPIRPRLTLSQLALAGLFIAVVLATPWIEIRGGFADLTRYQLNFAQNVYRLELSDNLFGLWQNELLWRWAVRTLAAANGGYAAAFALISSAAVVLTSAYVVIRARSALYLVALLSPLYIDLMFSQVRSAIAVALLYGALLLWPRLVGKALAPLCVLLATFLHNFAIVVAGLAGAFYSVRALRLGRGVSIALLLGGILVVVLFMTVLRNDVLHAIGDRRLFSHQTVSGIGLTVMVFSLSLPAWLRFREIAVDINVYLVVAAVLLHAGFFVTGFMAGPRIVAMVLPAIAVAASALRTPALRHGALAYIVLCNFAYFSIWAKHL